LPVMNLMVVVVVVVVVVAILECTKQMCLVKECVCVTYDERAIELSNKWEKLTLKDSCLPCKASALFQQVEKLLSFT